MSSAEYEHPELGYDQVEDLYEQIFFGHARKRFSRAPFGFAAMPLNGTQSLPSDIDSDAPLEIDWQFGVFPDPYARVINYIACIVADTDALPYSKILSSVKDLVVFDNDEKAAMMGLEEPVLATSLRRFYTNKFDLSWPIALITGWHFGIDSEQGEEVSMHFPNIAHPGSILAYLQSVAAQELMFVQKEDIGLISRPKPAKSDIEIYPGSKHPVVGYEPQCFLTAPARRVPVKDEEAFHGERCEKEVISDGTLFKEFF